MALFEEAAEKFAEILQFKESLDFQSIAAYGQGVALLSLAERDVQDGKAGSAFRRITSAIDGCMQLSSGQFSCVYKVLGDLYSFGALIPPSLFTECQQNNEINHDDNVKNQLEFISRGEEAYRSALVAIKATDNDGHLSALQSSCHCDIASNILLQADLHAARCNSSSSNSASSSLYDKASEEYKTALDLNPTNGIAWCGLGCAVDDPLLAQRTYFIVGMEWLRLLSSHQDPMGKSECDRFFFSVIASGAIAT